MRRSKGRKTVLWLPKPLLDDVRRIARLHGRSLSGECARMIELTLSTAIYQEPDIDYAIKSPPPDTT